MQNLFFLWHVKNALCISFMVYLYRRKHSITAQLISTVCMLLDWCRKGWWAWISDWILHLFLLGMAIYSNSGASLADNPVLSLLSDVLLGHKKTQEGKKYHSFPSQLQSSPFLYTQSDIFAFCWLASFKLFLKKV